GPRRDDPCAADAGRDAVRAQPRRRQPPPRRSGGRVRRGGGAGRRTRVRGPAGGGAAMTTVVRGGTVVTPEGEHKADLAITDGRIAAIGPDLPGGGNEIDARGLLV